jgi:dihydrofolate synthase/folylpolyglutamate synthase
MGGRLDATNVVEPRLSVITDVALDHQKYLGNTVGEIAREKAGIIRAGGAVVTLPQMPEANDVIGNTILDLGARAVSAVEFVPPVSPGSAEFWENAAKSIATGGTEATWANKVTPVRGEQIMVESPLLGRHQLRNSALAVAAAEELHRQGFAQITVSAIERGIRETRWPGRFHVIPAADGSPEMVLDVAHNPAGAWALRSTLSAAYEDRAVTMVFGVMRDKAVAEVAEILFPIAQQVVLTQANKAAARVEVEIRETSDVTSALAEARRIAGPGGLVVVTGSIYIVGEAMLALRIRI